MDKRLKSVEIIDSNLKDALIIITILIIGSYLIPLILYVLFNPDLITFIFSISFSTIIFVFFLFMIGGPIGNVKFVISALKIECSSRKGLHLQVFWSDVKSIQLKIFRAKSGIWADFKKRTNYYLRFICPTIPNYIWLNHYPFHKNKIKLIIKSLKDFAGKMDIEFQESDKVINI